MNNPPNTGLSMENPIVITGVTDEFEGVAAEHAWLRQYRPGCELVQQSLLKDGDRFYDRFEIKTSKGAESIYFDITAFYGK